MWVLPVLLVAATLLGVAVGGSLKHLATVRLRWWPLAFVGLALQVVPYPDAWGPRVPVYLLLLSFVLLTAFAVANVRLPGFPLLLAGVLMNFLVIGVNSGMPVSRDALIRSGQAESLASLEQAEGEKHHLADPDEDVLLFLGDVIPIGAPVNAVLSAGDIAMYAGVVWLISVRTRRPAPRHARGSVDRRAVPANDGRSRT